MPLWLVPVAFLIPIQPAPLRLATRASAAVEIAAVTRAQRAQHDARVVTIRAERFRSAMEFRTHQYKYLAAAPATVCNGNVCAIPVLRSLADNPYIEP